MDLLFPSDVRSVVVCDQQFDADENGIVRGIETHVAREMMAHDPRIQPFDASKLENSEERAASDAAEIRTARIAMINGLSRNGLFAEGRAQGLSFPASFSNEKMKSLLIQKIDAVPVTDEQLMTDEQRELAARANNGEARANVGGLVSGASTADAERDPSASAEGKAVNATINELLDSEAAGGGDPSAISRDVDGTDPLANRNLSENGQVGTEHANEKPVDQAGGPGTRQEPGKTEAPKPGEGDGRGGHYNVDEQKPAADNPNAPKPGESDGKGGHFNTE